MAQQKAREYRVPLILIESDVVIRPNTITGLLEVTRQAVRPGLIGVITVNEQGEFNFPYSNVRKEATSWSETSRSLSFCCTLISCEFLDVYDFKELPLKKTGSTFISADSPENSGSKTIWSGKTACFTFPTAAAPGNNSNTPIPSNTTSISF